MRALSAAITLGHSQRERCTQCRGVVKLTSAVGGLEFIQPKGKTMAAQKGKDLLLKVDADGAGTFTTVAGLRTRTIAFNAETVDITHTESAGRWRELLEGAGSKHARISGAGIFKDAASDALLRQYIFAGTIRNWQVVVPDFGIVQGHFQIATFEFTGRHDGEVGFDITIESAGELIFTAT
jgi:TP901-1 family phage major tail protein